MAKRNTYFTSIFLVGVFAVCWFLTKPNKSTPDIRSASIEKEVYYSNEISRWFAVNTEYGRIGRDTIQTNRPPFQDAVDKQNAKVLDIGPNLIPFLVEALRNDTTNLEKTVNTIWLLSSTSKIHLFNRIPRGEKVTPDNYPQTLPPIIAKFLSEWDRELYINPDSELEKHLPLINRAPPKGRIFPEDVRPISYFGVFALPWIIQQIGKSNSVYATCLFISRSGMPLSEYWANHHTMLTQKADKIALIKTWWSREHTKFNELHPLYEKIDAAVKALPNLPVETNAVASGSSP